LRDKGKVYIFDSSDLPLKQKEKVIVETETGPCIGRVVMEPKEVEIKDSGKEFKKVIRKVTDKDLQREESICQKEKIAHETCLQKIKAYGLPMKLVDVECLYDMSKIIFYFTSEGRVDFRELVRDLVHQLRMKVEMRQIGVRNEARVIGGIGSCGREICCRTFLSNFTPVSVRMAKDQNLSLNPAKLSGLCGRLMCCLAFEHETYLELKKEFPKSKAVVLTKYGKGEVKRQNILTKRVIVELTDGKEIEVPLEEIYSELEQGKSVEQSEEEEEFQ
jgi:cell fate regulator YaaT (PSP1 superfamily)